jgi:hypothetical protein
MTRPIDPALITYTNIIYALHALAVLFGIAGIRTVAAVSCSACHPWSR